VPAPAVAPVVVVPPVALQALSTATLLNNQSPDWLVGTLDGNADVVAVRFPSLTEQARAMNRLAAFAEKASAPRDRVLNDTELSAVIAREGDSPETFYLGHDYRITKIVHFFNQVQRQQLVLQPQEQRLAATLVDAGYIKKSVSYEAVAETKALITVSRMTPSDFQLLKLAANDRVLSAAVLEHEISHGEFLTRPSYHQQCWLFWQSVLTENERTKWRVLLKDMGYDSGNEELLVNEMQALLMHTPDARFFSAAHLSVSDQELARQRVRFAQTGTSVSK
jgi:hypothetical protein